jgi:hypothetical protein
VPTVVTSGELPPQAAGPHTATRSKNIVLRMAFGPFSLFQAESQRRANAAYYRRSPCHGQ